jgi:YjbE family integral membrane protein
MNLGQYIDVAALGALVSVVIIDLTLAGDNAIVVGMAARGLPRVQQQRVILLGIAAATALRIGFALITVQLLEIIGLTLAGGILLLWVAWKMYRELKHQRAATAHANDKPDGDEPGAIMPRKSFSQALFQVVLADVSMSLDNVLAVAGTARDHFWVLVTGLVLSVALMGVASTFVARVLDRYHWIAWIGLGIVAAVALRMIYEGTFEVLHHV